MREFDAIERYFRPLSGEGALSLLDDAAVIEPRPGFDTIITTDVLVEGVHFLASTTASDIAFKTLATNISDCVAKGGVPHGYFVGLSVPAASATDDWFSSFSSGLKDAQTQFKCSLLGGDTTLSLSGITVCITILGYVPEGRMIKRSGAKPGHNVYVTGNIGDGALGLLCARDQIDGFIDLESAYFRPQPPTQFVQNLISFASASADISDGLIADAGHVAAASGVGMVIYRSDVPLSSSSKRFLEKYPQHAHLPLMGGDDYQVVFTAPPEHGSKIEELVAHLNHKVTKIGVCREGAGIDVVEPDGLPLDLANLGYEHFRES